MANRVEISKLHILNIIILILLVLDIKLDKKHF